MDTILQYKNYTATVNFSAEDDVFYGKILGISDLVSFEGISGKDVKISFKEAVEDYIEICARLEKSPLPVGF